MDQNLLCMYIYIYIHINYIPYIMTIAKKNRTDSIRQTISDFVASPKKIEEYDPTNDFGRLAFLLFFGLEFSRLFGLFGSHRGSGLRRCLFGRGYRQSFFDEGGLRWMLCRNQRISWGSRPSKSRNIHKSMNVEK